MYHIWAPQCQIQLRRGQNSTHGHRTTGLPSTHCSIELSHPIWRGFGRMQNSDNPFIRQGRPDLGETYRDQGGLSGDRQRIEYRPFKQVLGASKQVRREPNVALETPCENFALDRVAQCVDLPGQSAPRRLGA